MLKPWLFSLFKEIRQMSYSRRTMLHGIA